MEPPSISCNVEFEHRGFTASVDVSVFGINGIVKEIEEVTWLGDDVPDPGMDVHAGRGMFPYLIDDEAGDKAVEILRDAFK